MESVLKYKNTVIAIVSILVFFLVAKKILSNYNIRNDEMSSKLKDIEAIEEMTGKLESVNKRLNDLRAKIFKGDIFVFKGTLEQNVRGSDVTIQSFKPRAIKETKDYEKVRINMNISANYGGLVKLVHIIENFSGTIISLKRNKKFYNLVFEITLRA